MRIYAVVLGVVLTAGAASLAQLAVASAGFERLPARSFRGGDLAAAGELWYGGVLAPVTVEATRTRPTPWTVNRQLALSQKAVECAHLARPKRYSIASDNVHGSLGSMGSMM